MSLPKRLSLWKPQLDTLSKQPTFLILTFGKYLPSFLLLGLRGPPAPGERGLENAQPSAALPGQPVFAWPLSPRSPRFLACSADSLLG